MMHKRSYSPRFGSIAWGLVLLLLVVLPGGFVQAQAFDSSARVKVSAVPGLTHVAPGGDLPVAVIFDHDENWHIHTHAPKVPPELGDPTNYIATKIAVDTQAAAASSLTAHPDFIQWPEVYMARVAFLREPVEYGVFHGKAVAYVPVTVARDASPGPASIDLLVTYQACDDSTCLRPVFNQRLTVTVEIVEPAALAGIDATPAEPELFAAFNVEVWPQVRSGARLLTFDLFGWEMTINAAGFLGLTLLLLIAGLGGFLLNLTPCVLPVIPIKIIGLSQAAGSRGRCLALGLSMTAGVMTFWLGLGVAIASVSHFTATNQLFQYPLFTIGVGLFIAAMAVGMCGLFAVRLPQAVYLVNPKHDTLGGSFLFGIMTAVLSTPCTAPFMGTALGWAATQPAFISLTTFAAIGLGMALPYLVLSAWPKLVEKMPRTGPASELIKQVMGLLMLAAAAYFVGVGVAGLIVSPPDPPTLLYWWPVVGFIVAAGGWLAWRTIRITASAAPRTIFGGLGAVMVLLALFLGVRLTDRGPITWTYYTPERFAQALHEGRIVVVDFTAEWCLNCKALEQSVLYDRRVVQLFESGQALAMKVDLTGNNPLGNAKLRDTGRLTIPLLVIYGPDGSELFKSDFYTVEQVVSVVSEASAGAVAVRDGGR